MLIKNIDDGWDIKLVAFTVLRYYHRETLMAEKDWENNLGTSDFTKGLCDFFKCGAIKRATLNFIMWLLTNPQA